MNFQQQQPLQPPRRTTIIPPQSSFSQSAARRRSTLAPSTFKSRQLSHLNVQLAKLQANMSDLDNLLRVTAVQAEYIRKLGILHASLYVIIFFLCFFYFLFFYFDSISNLYI